MKKHKILPLVLFAIALSFQSCFEIREVVKFNKDGSGSFSLIIDLSQVKTMLEGFGGGEEIEGGSPFENMELEYEATRAQLEEIEGISNITFTSEMDGYLITSGFDFTSLEALNRGMDAVYENESENEGVPEYYIFKKRNFVRTAAHNFMDQVKNELGSDEMNVEGMDLAAIFSEVAYVNEVIFEGRKIRKVKSGSVEVSEDGTSAVNKYLIFNDEIEQSLEYKLVVK